MRTEEKIQHILVWLEEQLTLSGQSGFVLGVSGGVDSAVTSTLCALTGHPVLCLNLPINQASDQFSRSEEHISWLKGEFSNVSGKTVDLTETYKSLKATMEISSELVLANAQSRLRMTTIYSFANEKGFLVAGTGNKVEDYGIGFFTKYGDGGVDLSPIADLLKSEVYEIAEFLGVVESIRTAQPTDGLWGDNRTDEEQIGASYDELEWALNYYDENGSKLEGLTERQTEVLDIYVNRHVSNKHKLETPPVCLLN
jgi:NAD+ synthase